MVMAIILLTSFAIRRPVLVRMIKQPLFQIYDMNVYTHLNVLKMNYRMLSARLAQSVEHETLNLGVVGSSPTLGEISFYTFYYGIYTAMLHSK